MRKFIPVVLIAALALAGCASDGSPRPTPSQITDAVVIALQGAASTATDIVRIWEKNPGSGDEAAEVIQKINLSVTAAGNLAKTNLQILEALGYLPSPQQQAAIDKAMAEFNAAAVKVGADTLE